MKTMTFGRNLRKIRTDVNNYNKAQKKAAKWRPSDRLYPVIRAACLQAPPSFA